MTARNESKLNMYRTVKQLCDDNTTTVALNAAFLAAFNIFKAKLSTLITTVTSESQVIKGIAVDKKVLKQNLCQTTADIAARCVAGTRRNHRSDLHEGIAGSSRLFT